MLTWAILSALLLVLVGLLVDWRVRVAGSDAVHDQLQQGLTQVTDQARRAHGAPDAVGSGNDVVQLLDDGGEVIASSPAAPSRRLLTQGDLQRVRDGDLTIDRADVPDLGGGAWRIVAMSTSVAQRDVVAVAAAPTGLRDDLRRSLERWLAAGLLVAWLVLLGAALLLRRSTMGPVARLRASTDRSVGKSRTLRIPLDPTAGPLIGALAGSINRILAALDASRQRERTVVAATARELHDPVRSLRSELDQALARKRPAEQLRDALQEMRPQIGRLEQLTDDLGLIASGDARNAFGEALAREAQQVPVRPVVDEVVAGVRPEFAEADRVLRATVGTDANVRANADALRRALDGLIRNALEHGAGDVVVAVSERGAVVHFEVRDSGGGFHPDVLAGGIESISRGDGADEGRGLGLAIVVSVARAHGGDAGIANAADEAGVVEGGIAWFALARRSGDD